MRSDRHRFVLENIHRVTNDGVRQDPRYELDGVCVSMQVRSLLAKGLIVSDEQGLLVESTSATVPNAGPADPSVVADIRRLLLG